MLEAAMVEPATPRQPTIPSGFDFTDPDLYSQRVPVEEFAELRRTAPVWWNPQRPKG
jgi:cholest-4-en-3-one 26-monooxygenase